MIKHKIVPFFSLNDDLKSKELKRQIKEMKNEGIDGFFMHARPGLITPYLSSSWMKKLEICIKEAEKYKMFAWLYDEDRWPSGFASGKVASLSQTHWQKIIRCIKFNNINKAKKYIHNINTSEIIGIFSFTQDKKEIKLKRINDLKFDNQEGKKFFIFQRFYGPSGRYFNNYPYVDLLSKKTTQTFIASTYEKYWKNFAKYFGNVIPGIFTDEPHCTPDEPHFPSRRGLAWTDNFSKYFYKKNGYSIEDSLPSLFYKIGNYQKIRFDFFKTIASLFLNSYTIPLYQWCRKHKLYFTGHYFPEDDLREQTYSTGNLMPHYEYMHIPGIDWLGRNKVLPQTVKQVSSVAHQLGKKRVLSESFGCSGWNMSFEDYKWIAEQQYCLGINLLTPHLLAYSLKGLRKRDFPPSIYYQQPYWKYHHLIANYFNRLSYILTQGKFKADILVIHPIRSSWALFDLYSKKETNKLNKSFSLICKNLLELHYDYDLADEHLIEKYAKIKNKFILGKMSYSFVIIPPCLTLSKTTFKLLTEFINFGGKIIAIKPLPTKIDAISSEEIVTFFKQKNIMVIENKKNNLKKILDTALLPQIKILNSKNKEIPSIWYQYRIWNKKKIYFLVNTSKENSFFAKVIINQLDDTTNHYSIEEYDLTTGKNNSLTYKKENENYIIYLEFAPCQSHLLILNPFKKICPLKTKKIIKTEIIDLTNWQVKRQDLNALTIDYCKLKTENKEYTSLIPVLEAQEKLLQLKENTKFSVQYFFYVDSLSCLKKQLYLVMESPLSYLIKINNNLLSSKDKGWWQDISFRKIEIEEYVQLGENVVEINGSFKSPTKKETMIFLKKGTEIESVYIIGEFAVKKIKEKFVITDEDTVIKDKNFVNAGYPFFTGTFSLFLDFEIKSLEFKQVFLELEKISAIAVEIKLNNKDAGILIYRPFRLEVKKFLKLGKNLLEIKLVNSLRNLLGPHHHKKEELFNVSPDSFHDKKNWVNSYNFVPFGLLGKSFLKLIY